MAGCSKCVRQGSTLRVCPSCIAAALLRPLQRGQRRDRSAAEVYARTHGYFWLPCPVCGEPFGGHEWNSRNSIPIPSEPGTGQGICQACADTLGRHEEDAVCSVQGHDISETWNMVATAESHRGNRYEISGTFDTAMPPSERYCARCFRTFDPLTHEPLPRPSPFQENQ